MQFEFATAGRILFGSGKLSEAGKLLVDFGRMALVVTGGEPSRCQPLVDTLKAQGMAFVQFAVHGEPTNATVRDGVELARAQGCEMVIGMGGGSALDAAKAIAALLTNAGDVDDYLEVVGRGKTLTMPSAPYVAIPTTAGTGTEVSRNAVLSVPAHRVKVSLRSPHMLARLAIVDPALTLSMPPEVTASTGVDALTQLIEPFVCNLPNPITDAICRAGFPLVARSLLRAYKDGSDLAAREDMALAALYSGMAMANARLGGVHGFAGVLGGALDAPHGMICARLLPFVMRANLRALIQRDPQNPAIQRYAEVARWLTGILSASAEDGVAWVEEVCEALDILPLSEYGLTRAQFPVIIEKSARASSMKGNSIALNPEEMEGILDLAL